MLPKRVEKDILVCSLLPAMPEPLVNADDCIDLANS